MTGLSSTRAAWGSPSQESAGALILLYHRVIDLPRDPQLLCVSPRRFARQMEIIRRRFAPMSLFDLVNALAQGEAPQRAVAVTFDDGYADNLNNAWPVLEGYEIPATVFVTPRDDGQVREFWWDSLERLILSSPILPECLEITAAGQRRQWRIDRDDRPSAEDAGWNVLSSAPHSARQRLYLSLCEMLRPLNEPQRRGIVDELFERFEMAFEPRPTHRALSALEIIRLAGSDLIEVGAHTLSHPRLAALPPDQQSAEIVGSKERLETILEREVSSFSYPYGGRDDYTEQSVAAVREAGFVCACSNPGRTPSREGLVLPGCDPFQLPRVLVRDWDGEEFESRLESAWFACTGAGRNDHVAAHA